MTCTACTLTSYFSVVPQLHIHKISCWYCLFLGGDIFIHAKSNNRSKLFELAQRIISQLPAGSVESFEDIYGWVYQNGRDLSGFIDGGFPCNEVIIVDNHWLGCSITVGNTVDIMVINHDHAILMVCQRCANVWLEYLMC